MGDDGENPAKEKRDLSISYVPDDADLHFKDMGFEVGSYVPEDADSHFTDMGFEVGSYVPDDADLHFEDMGFEVGSYVPDDADSLLTDMGFEVGSYVPDDADLHFEDMGFEVGSYVPEDADSILTDMGFEVGSYVPDDADLHFEDMGFRVGSHDADLQLDNLGFPIGSYTHEDMGCVLGGIKFVDRHLNVTDCTQFRVVNIPLDVDGITITNISAKFILLVEKIDLAKRLRASRFYSQFPCVIVATMGRVPDYCTRKFLYMLNKGEDLKLQLFALLDCIPHSIKTMSDLIHCDKLDINWLGIQPCHVCELMKARVLGEHMIHKGCNKKECLDLLELSLQRQHHRSFCEQLRLMLEKVPYKVPVEALSYDYLIDCYLPRQLTKYSLGVPVTK